MRRGMKSLERGVMAGVFFFFLFFFDFLFAGFDDGKDSGIRDDSKVVLASRPLGS